LYVTNGINHRDFCGGIHLRMHGAYLVPLSADTPSATTGHGVPSTKSSREMRNVSVPGFAWRPRQYMDLVDLELNNWVSAIAMTTDHGETIAAYQQISPA
jgi:hypothetical protein